MSRGFEPGVYQRYVGNGVYALDHQAIASDRGRRRESPAKALLRTGVSVLALKMSELNRSWSAHYEDATA